MYITFLNENESELGVSETQSTLNSSWTEFDTILPIPPHTRDIKFTLMGTRNGGQDNDSYFDDLFLRVVKDETCLEMVTIISNQSEILKQFTLYQNFPNPFNSVTILHYDLPEDAMVSITIYDMMGRKVKTLVNGSQTAGYKSIQWNATNNTGQPVSAGLYLYTIQAGQFSQTKKIILLK